MFLLLEELEVLPFLSLPPRDFWKARQFPDVLVEEADEAFASLSSLWSR